jgi:L-iditol 2-dehydrogenase
MMLVAAVTGPRAGEVVEKPDPTPKDEFVVVKVHAAPMCTEYTAFVDGHVSDSLGHEAAGEVVAVDRAEKVRAGDRVVVMPQYPCGRCALCRSGEYIHCENSRDMTALFGEGAATATMAQYVLKQDWLLVPIPDGMSYDHASIACCGFGPVFGALELTGAQAGETVLIVGLGPVGLGGVIVARDRGCRVIGVDLNPYRMRLAHELGAERVLKADDADVTGLGADVVVRCTPAAGTERLAVDAARRKGRVAFVGWGGEVPVSNVIAKGLSLHGAWHYNLNAAPRMMELIGRTSREIDRLITHTFPLTRVQEAWELQASGQCGKVILHPWEGA